MSLLLYCCIVCIVCFLECIDHTNKCDWVGAKMKMICHSCSLLHLKQLKIVSKV